MTKPFFYVDQIFENLIQEMDVCRNCLCTDCGCCQGCGGINADADLDIYSGFRSIGGLTTHHGYACVM